MEDRRRHRRVAAVVGLLAGVALLLGAVVDGGMASPTRADGPGAVAAVAHSDVGTAATAGPREDHPAWGASVLPSLPRPTGTALVPGLALLAALLVAAGPGHRAPALAAVRRRGPPVTV